MGKRDDLIMWKAFNYEHADFDGLIKLTKDYYGNIDASEKEFVDWGYFKNPAGNAIIKIAKNENNEVVGQYILTIMRIEVFGKVEKATLSLNTLTNKEYSGQGIFTTLSENAYSTCSAEGYAFTYGYPNQNSYPGFVNKLKFTKIHEVPLLVYPCNLRSLVKKKLSKHFACFVPNLFFKLKTREYSANIIEIKQNDLDLIDAFWEEIKGKYPIILTRDKTYFQWRYFDIPMRKYRVFAYKKDARIMGYIVLTIREIDGVKSGMIIDFLTSDDNVEIGKELVYKCYEVFKQNKTELLGSLMLEHTSEYRILKKCGFIRCPKFLQPQPFPLIYRAHRKEYETKQMTQVNNWFVTMGDYDAV